MADKRAQFELVPGQFRIENIVGNSFPSDAMLSGMRPDQVALARQGVIGFVFERQVSLALQNGGMEPLLKRTMRANDFTAQPTSLFGGIQVRRNELVVLELDSVLIINGNPVYIEYKSGGPGKSLRFNRLDGCYRALQSICGQLHGTRDDCFRAGLTVVTPARTGVDLSRILWENGVRKHGGIIYRTQDTLPELQRKILRIIQQQLPRKK